MKPGNIPSIKIIFIIGLRTLKRSLEKAYDVESVMIVEMIHEKIATINVFINHRGKLNKLVSVKSRI